MAPNGFSQSLVLRSASGQEVIDAITGLKAQEK